MWFRSMCFPNVIWSNDKRMWHVSTMSHSPADGCERRADSLEVFNVFISVKTFLRHISTYRRGIIFLTFWNRVWSWVCSFWNVEFNIPLQTLFICCETCDRNKLRRILVYLYQVETSLGKTSLCSRNKHSILIRDIESWTPGRSRFEYLGLSVPGKLLRAILQSRSGNLHSYKILNIHSVVYVSCKDGFLFLSLISVDHFHRSTSQNRLKGFDAIIVVKSYWLPFQRHHT